MDTTCLIMAAGLGSRFGTGIKQLEKVDDYGHIIMDYSIHDALEAGCNKIVFIIRRDIEKDFRDVIGNRIEAYCAQKNVEVHYVFQDFDDIPSTPVEGRTKPWGTGHAVLSARHIIKEPFIVINADDYYGKEGFKVIHDYLASQSSCCMAGFVLKNTLSENGTVTRGICMEENGFLKKLVETKDILKTEDGATCLGKPLNVDSLCSMNMWGFTPEFMNTLDKGFRDFFKNEVPKDPLKAEFLIPIYVGQLLEKDELKVKVLESHDTWYGMTYKEDVQSVKESFHKMIEQGKYTKELYE